jgi:hypothetical protein
MLKTLATAVVGVLTLTGHVEARPVGTGPFITPVLPEGIASWSLWTGAQSLRPVGIYPVFVV